MTYCDSSRILFGLSWFWVLLPVYTHLLLFYYYPRKRAHNSFASGVEDAVVDWKVLSGQGGPPSLAKPLICCFVCNDRFALSQAHFPSLFDNLSSDCYNTIHLRLLTCYEPSRCRCPDGCYDLMSDDNSVHNETESHDEAVSWVNFFFKTKLILTNKAGWETTQTRKS